MSTNIPEEPAYCNQCGTRLLPNKFLTNKVCPKGCDQMIYAYQTLPGNTSLPVPPTRSTSGLKLQKGLPVIIGILILILVGTSFLVGTLVGSRQASQTGGTGTHNQPVSISITKNTNMGNAPVSTAAAATATAAATNTPAVTPTATAIPTVVVAPTNSSGLIFGTNLHLDNANDPFLTSQGFRNGLKAAGVQFIRLPIRTVGAPDAISLSAAQQVQAMGATPLIILKYTQTDPAGAAASVVQAMNNIFGNKRVYYEFGNERDLAGVNAQAYTAEWNLVVPTVKHLANNAWIGGSVNFQANPQYIAYFVKNATTAPDFISWHWYTCNSADSDQTCLGNISHFPGHVSDTRNAILANGNTVPPIMITEWNYAPDSNVPNDNKHNDPAFLKQWTTMALQQLTDPANNIFASDIYDVTNVLPLSDTQGNLTTQGQVFKQIHG